MTTTRVKLLQCLEAQQGRWVSGQQISGKLGISRTAIWKHVNRLKKDGYEIESVPKKGYCLTRTVDRLDGQDIGGRLRTRTMGRPALMVLEETDSTNLQAKALAAGGAAEGTVVLADAQTTGRGRRGRHWHSPAGRNIYISIILRPPMNPSQAPRITLMAAVALARTLIDTAGLQATIKWPNDIMVRGRKLAGILTEISTEMDQVDYVVVGMGINVHIQAVDLPEDIADIATSVAIETGNPIARADLVADLLARFEACYRQLLREGFIPIMAQWRQLTDIIGRRVFVDVVNTRHLGIVRDVDDDGVLLLEDDQKKLHRIFSGDVTRLRRD